MPGKSPSPDTRARAQTFLYRCARSDPTFRPSASVPLQAYGNALGVAAGASVPTHASVACDADGYRQEALLFVDEEWTNTAAARGGMSTFLWRPCVKFCATHYRYVRDPSTQLPRIVQQGVGVTPDSTVGQYFRQPAPPSTTGGAELAACDTPVPHLHSSSSSSSSGCCNSRAAAGTPPSP